MAQSTVVFSSICSPVRRRWKVKSCVGSASSPRIVLLTARLPGFSSFWNTGSAVSAASSQRVITSPLPWQTAQSSSAPPQAQGAQTGVALLCVKLSVPSPLSATTT